MSDKATTGKWLALVLVLALAGLAGCEENDSCGECNATDDDADDDTAGGDDCLACHSAQADAWQNNSSHKTLYDCAFCHEQVLDTPGVGHRAKPGCDDCHSEATHIPTYYPTGGFRLISCTTCHDPHGSQNIYLVQRHVLTGPGELSPINFQSIVGLGAGSYAATEPGAGSGLCEACHTATKFYNRYGTGEAHFTTRCTDCHNHAFGFLPNS